MVEDPGEEMIDGCGRPAAWTWQAAREGVTADATLVIALLADRDPLVRVNAAHLLAGKLSPPPAVAASLRARLTVEHSPTVRAGLVLARAQLAANTDVPWFDDFADPAEWLTGFLG